MIKFDKDTKILIVGLGLIGGSYAKALSKRGCRVSAITLDQKDIDYAISEGFIASGSTEPDDRLIKEADMIVFALYPTVFIEWIKKNQHLFAPGTLITDVSGVKVSVVGEVQRILRDDIEFISAHPMAGREQSGVEFSDDTVFKGANYIVTPTEKNTPEAIETAKELGRALGFAHISELSPEKHDEMIGFLSQLTHCIAVTLMTSNNEDGLEKYTGDSFRDLTRIAKINEVMWSELFLMNRDVLLSQMDNFEAEFRKLRGYIENGEREEMQKMMRLSTNRRKKFDKK
jgi:prephenate dehydrogenase